jgi:MFS family permease
MAVAGLFLTNGALFASLLPRYPEIKADLALSNTVFGLCIAAFPAGALLSGLTAGVLIRRFGSARVAVVSSVLIAVFTFAAAIAPIGVLFAVALFVAGAADSITDVAQNANALQVQRNYGRFIINSLHAVWSVGAITGGALGAAAIAIDLPRADQLLISGVVFAAVSLIGYRYLLPGPEADDRQAAPALADGAGGTRALAVYGTLAALTLLAIAGAVVEDAGSSWSTLYLNASLGAPAAVAPLGYIALMGAQFVGRILGDRLIDRFGPRAVAWVGGLIAAVGMGCALAFPSVPGTVAGFAAAGFGVATVIPAAFHGADELPGLRPGTGLTLVTWLMRFGFLLSPPIVGAIADHAGLRVALVVVPAAGIATILLAGVLARTRN